MKKYYVISSTECTTLKEAENKVRDWQEDGILDVNCRVYEITEKNKVYEPGLKLEEIR